MDESARSCTLGIGIMDLLGGLGGIPDGVSDLVGEKPFGKNPDPPPQSGCDADIDLQCLVGPGIPLGVLGRVFGDTRVVGVAGTGGT